MPDAASATDPSPSLTLRVRMTVVSFKFYIFNMKKIISTILIIATLAATGIFSFSSPQKAEAAAPGATINWRTYQSGIRNYLMGYSPIAGKTCPHTRTATRASYCLSQTFVNRFMSWLRDPNGDGNFGDAIWVYDTYGRRQKMKEKAKSGFYPSVLIKIVIPWEISTHYSVIYENLGPLDSLTYKRIITSEIANAFLDQFDEFRFVSDYITDDVLIRDLAYWKDGELAPGVPKLGLKPKTKISSTALDKIYATQRMTPFIQSRNNTDWGDDEAAAMNNAVSFQNSVERFIQQGLRANPNATPEQIRQMYENAKLTVGAWDAARVALMVAPGVIKAGKVFGLIKTGAKTANVLSRMTKITINGQKVAAETAMITKVTGQTSTLTPTEAEFAITFIDDTFNSFKKGLSQQLPSAVKKANLWNDVDVQITRNLHDPATGAKVPGVVGRHENGQLYLRFDEQIFKIPSNDIARDLQGNPLLNSSGVPIANYQLDITFNVVWHELGHVAQNISSKTGILGGPMVESATSLYSEYMLQEFGMFSLDGYGNLREPLKELIKRASKSSAQPIDLLKGKFFKALFSGNQADLTNFIQSLPPKAPADFGSNFQTLITNYKQLQNAAATYRLQGDVLNIELFERRSSETYSQINSLINQVLPQ